MAELDQRLRRLNSAGDEKQLVKHLSIAYNTSFQGLATQLGGLSTVHLCQEQEHILLRKMQINVHFGLWLMFKLCCNMASALLDLIPVCCNFVFGCNEMGLNQLHIEFPGYLLKLVGRSLVLRSPILDFCLAPLATVSLKRKRQNLIYMWFLSINILLN